MSGHFSVERTRAHRRADMAVLRAHELGAGQFLPGAVDLVVDREHLLPRLIADALDAPCPVVQEDEEPEGLALDGRQQAAERKVDGLELEA